MQMPKLKGTQKIAIVMAVAVVAALVISFLWGPASQ